MDHRRRHWQPIDVHVAHGRTGKKLLAKFGRDGLLVWNLYLLACKRNVNEGEFTYHSEQAGWADLGLPYPHTPAFTLDEFFSFTGQLKKTRKTRSGDVVKTLCTSWGDWKVKKRTASGDTENPRSEATFTDTIRTDYGHDTDTMRPLTITTTDTFTDTVGKAPPSRGGRYKSSIFDRWVSLAPPLMKHRPGYLADEKVRRRIASVLRHRDPAEVEKAVENYAQVLSSQHHFFEYRWTFFDFLHRGLDKFVDEAAPLENFRRRELAALPGQPGRKAPEFSCPECGMEFTSSMTRREHLEEQHGVVA